MTGDGAAWAHACRVEPLREEDIPELVALARDTWHRHYPAIISVAQIEYMLAERYDPQVIRAQLRSPDTWWDKLSLEGRMAAFANYERGRHAGEIKIDKLYASYALRGRGLGSILLQHVEQKARAMGATRLYLQVNKNNASAIAAYRKNGFEIAASAVFDIGGGFVMDDYVMEKILDARPRAGS
jgi:ribosomal protein S18 acetylase RimI-like enzyme